MQVINFVLLFTLFQAIFASKFFSQMNYKHGIRNFKFKAVIFKDKRYPKLLNFIKQKYKFYYEVSMGKIGETIIEYENLSYEEKEMIDLMISSIFN